MQNQNTTSAQAGAMSAPTNGQVMSFTKFRAIFKPKINHFREDEDGAWFGTAFACMTEVDGEELQKQLDFVAAFNKSHPNQVWTIVDSESIDDVVAQNLYVCTGDKPEMEPLGYIISEIPFDPSMSLSVNIFPDDRP